MKTIMDTKICKHICAALSLVMLCGVPFTGTAYSAGTELKTQQTDEAKPTSPDVSSNTSKFVEASDVTTLKTSGKIDDQLCEILEKAEDDELIPVSIWITDIDFEEVEKKLEAEVGLSRNILEQKSDALRNDFVTQIADRLYSADTMTAVTDSDFVTAFKDYKDLNKAKVERFDNDVETYVIEQRNTAKGMHVKSNGEFVDTFLSDAVDIRTYEFFPIIDCRVTKEKVLYLASLSVVQSISSNPDKDFVYPSCMFTDAILSVNEDALMPASSSIYDGDEAANTIAVNVESINGDYTRDSLGFDGGRIKIGQIDQDVPDKTVNQLKNSTIETHGYTTPSSHATLVASILVGTDGMAPGAKLYSVPFDGYTSTLRANVDDLIGDGVNVINMSAHVVDGYDTLAKNLADFVVYNYNITWVNASGNQNEYFHPTYDVNSPATAHNVIAVGATDTKGDLNPANDTIADYSCYLTTEGLSAKPEVVAPGNKYYDVYSGDYVDGTSFATPLVAGLAAQLMSFSSELVLKPEAIKAAIIASCDHKTPDITSTAYINNKEGAGVVDALNAANSLSLMKLQKTYYNTSNYPIQHTLYPITDGTKSVAISWLRKIEGTEDDIKPSPLVNFNLYVYYSDTGNYPSASSTNGYEYVCFDASKSKTYKIHIQRTGSSGTTERIALAINR